MRIVSIPIVNAYRDTEMILDLIEKYSQSVKEEES